MANPKRILKRFLRILAVLMAIPLVLVVLLVAVPFAGSIGLQQEALPPDASVTLRRAHAGERWMLGAGRILDRLTGMPKDLPDAASYHSEHFYPGGESAGETWHLGYAQAVITPEDWETKAYYEGGNISIPARRLTAKLDELKVRAIALSTGEGVHIFAAVDSIGVTNRQVQQIRALVADMGLQSVNIAATHTHSAVDTIGFYSKGGNVDLDYLAFMNEKTAGAIRAAVAALEPGKLYISQIGATSMEDYDRRLWEKVGIDWEKDEWNDEWGEKYDRVYEEMLAEVSIAEYGLGDYIRNRRTPWAAYPTRLTKLRFVPLNPESRETALVNFAAHAYTAGLKLPQWAADSISGDFPYYMEEVFNEVGANFVYFGGAANAVYPQRQSVPDKRWDEDEDAYWEDYWKPMDWQVQRMGRDFAGVALAMTMPPEEIAANELLNPDNDHSYEYRKIITIMQNNGTVRETELLPQLDVRLQALQIDIENPFVRWAAKRETMNFTMLRNGKQLKLATEIGYAELGGAVTIALLPGEFTPGLAWGGGGTSEEYAIRQRAFGHPTLSESAGRDVIVFGICNDEIGYVIPDNDYIAFHNPFSNMNYKLLNTDNYDHYQELLSPGPRTASTIAEAFAVLAGQ